MLLPHLPFPKHAYNVLFIVEWLYRIDERVTDLLGLRIAFGTNSMPEGVIWHIDVSLREIEQTYMPLGRLPKMELTAAYDAEHTSSTQRIRHEFWPLDEVDSKKAKFPCCIVWTPLPVVSWLAPFIGHVGICMEDGAVLDFAGSNFVNVDDFAFGAVARYLQLDREQVHTPSLSLLCTHPETLCCQSDHQCLRKQFSGK